ncbi:sensor histidine kinase [Dinghuibacter silviterrae]|uniref:histidine kinase n=1 Tax=Dinghuibacter silviterrae TaxID=1539049 RepID=A0A4R8DV45_9BACT|nr:ATP-binding protein [Dinghuibacter silviterrae]TDX01866.1 histidine kinase/DNA gyrase B/HSP90-like ATPase [Dinghuibacter silviterrae]
MQEEVWVVLVAGSLIFLVLVGILVFVLLFYQKRRFQHARKLLEMEKTYSEAMLLSQLEIREETFRNISQEIHDNIGQVLSFIKLNLNTLNLHGDDRDEDKLRQSRGLLTRAIQDLRDIARTLDTDFIKDMGLAEAIEQQLTILGKSFATTYVEEGKSYRLDVRVELVGFRVVQELLNNIVKHAGASEIGIRIGYGEDQVAVEIRDNGSGFVLEEATPGRGLGLRNMISRMELIRGQIRIDRLPEGGSLATILLPND